MDITHHRYFPAILILACVVLLTGAGAAQQPGCQSPCDPPTAWQDFNSFTLTLTAPGVADYSEWQGSINQESNDIQVDVESLESGSVIKGKILMIGGRVMAIQGPIAKPGSEIDALDVPVLQVQLVTKLLGRALPNGPASIQSEQPHQLRGQQNGRSDCHSKCRRRDSAALAGRRRRQAHSGPTAFDTP